MTTVISAHNSDGCIGRCDSKCHDATHETCTCICGGANHGKGLETAISNTRQMAENWIESYNAANSAPITWEIDSIVTQICLPGF